MGTVIRIIQPTGEELAQEWIDKVNAKYLACRGYGHAFPKPTDKRSRKHFKLTRDTQGSILEMTCRDCGAIRYVTAEPGAIIQLPAKHYKYILPDGYKVPKGAGKHISRNRCANEAMRRYYEELEHQTGGEEMPRFIGGESDAENANMGA